MKKLLSILAIMLFSSGVAQATEKSRTALQTDLLNDKNRSFNAETMYENMINMTDSHFNITSDAVTSYSSDADANPVMFGARKSLSAAQVNTGTATILEAGASNYLTLHHISLNASGSAAGATAVVVECDDGTDIASFPVAMLVDDVPVSPYSSVGGGFATLSEELVNGCGQDEDIRVVKTGGSLSGTSDLIVNFTYTIQ